MITAACTTRNQTPPPAFPQDELGCPVRPWRHLPVVHHKQSFKRLYVINTTGAIGTRVGLFRSGGGQIITPRVLFGQKRPTWTRKRHMSLDFSVHFVSYVLQAGRYSTAQNALEVGWRCFTRLSACKFTVNKSMFARKPPLCVATAHLLQHTHPPVKIWDQAGFIHTPCSQHLVTLQRRERVLHHTLSIPRS